MQFFNTAFLLLLANANFSETHIPFMQDIFVGKYTDFHPNWFAEAGETLVKAMVINAFMPAIEFCGFWTMKEGLRRLDRSFGRDTYKSKKKSILQYVEAYSGPEYLIHFRYSSILNNVFVTMMYGTALPILYPISLVAFIVLYCTERCLIFYYYKQPPSFD